jgi:hypothetical protein
MHLRDSILLFSFFVVTTTTSIGWRLGTKKRGCHTRRSSSKCSYTRATTAASGNSSKVSSKQNKRNFSPSTPTDKTPSKRPKTASNFVAVEDVALCKAYVKVTLNPVDRAGQKSSQFWD